MDVSNELVYNFLVDLKKKEINPMERAKIIEAYMLENKLGLRELASELGMPHTTLKGWLDYIKISDTYDDLVKAGASKTTIHNQLRGVNKKELATNQLNYELVCAMSKLKPYIHDGFFNKETKTLISELRNTLNRIEIRVQR